ncbi:hypothetical protein F4780DRAFT_746974 [Xylariomycetidae sp. FL0641]|nr:hypothetical protein F4780DRAFT_746974 [Xylariomycetidae sp. FL0641]
MQADTPSGEPTLLGLPVELLLLASSYLSTRDLLSLRRTCTRIENRLKKSIGLEFFTERRFLITHSSLQTLIDISMNASFSKELKHLTIGLDRFSSKDVMPHFGEYHDHLTYHTQLPPFRGGIHTKSFIGYAVEQNFLVNSGHLQSMLTEALGNLKGLESLSLADSNVPSTSCRPGARPLVVGYGAPRVFRESGVNFCDEESHFPAYERPFADTVFAAVLLALSNSGTRLKELGGLAVRIQQNRAGLSTSAFALPDFVRRDLDPVLSRLTSLDLSINFCQAPGEERPNSSAIFFPWQHHQVLSLLALTPNISKLRLEAKDNALYGKAVIQLFADLLCTSANEDEAPETESSRTVDSGGSSDLLPLINANGTALSSRESKFRVLEELEFDNFMTRPRSLGKVLSLLSGSLKKLHLKEVTLEIHNKDNEFDNKPDYPNAWTALFQELNKLNLEEISLVKLGHHTECAKNTRVHQVAFLHSNIGAQDFSSPQATGVPVAWHSSARDRMDDFLDELSSKTIIICSTCKEKNPDYWTAQGVEEALWAALN